MNIQFDYTVKTIVVAGASGKLGLLIAQHLIWLGASVTALVRNNASADDIDELKKMGCIIIFVDYDNPKALRQAVNGASCVISALSGLEDVIIGTQTRLLNAAVAAGIPRFMPSDFSIDYTKLVPGSNRNLDLRRQFAAILDKAPIKATSVLNGMFMELLKGQAPVILFERKRIFFWGDADQLLDFTTMENTAAFTAHAALDDDAPRYLRIAGSVASVRDLQQIATYVTHKSFKLLRAGGLGLFQLLIRFTRLVYPQKKEIFPVWQGMQYLHNMFTGLPKLNPLDNDRYPDIRWTSVRDILANRVK